MTAPTESLDVLYRSRITLLDHLDSVGYNTEPFRRFSTKELAEMIKGTAPALHMELTLKDGVPTVDGQPTKCFVAYSLLKIKQKLAAFVGGITGQPTFDMSTTELIVICIEPIAPNFHAFASEMWMADKLRLRFFQAAALVTNPMKHVLVPPHEKVPAAEVTDLLKGMYAKKSQLPLIRFHEDPIARLLGLVPGDVVKITRPSPTAGECIMYRVCVP
jgi:DNA-directed RNA polymerase subunit H (RpoH/RPB5)